MIPSPRWFPSSLQERAAWFDNFTAQFGSVATSLGFSAADVTALANDNDIMQFLAQATKLVDSYTQAVRQYRLIITEGDKGDPTPVFPTALSLSPVVPVPTGIFERLDDLVKRIRVAPEYTDEIGALLGIIPKSSNQGQNALEPDLKPVIKASESFNGYKFTVNVTRLGMEAFKVQIQRKDSTSWEDAAFATNNPVQVTVSPEVAGNPERVLVRAVLLQKNNPIGQPSDPTYVTVNP